MHPAYTTGKLHAFKRIGLHKLANAMLKELAVPTLAGGTLGGIGGAVAGGEGNRMQGALLGAGLGAGGAAVGKGLGRLANKYEMSSAAKGLDEAYTTLGKTRRDALRGSMSGEAADAARATAKSGVGTATEHLQGVKDRLVTGDLERGATMLGGVAGAGTGMGLIAGKESPPTKAPMPNPYGY